MNHLSVELVWTKIQMGMTILGGWLGYFLGGMDGLMIALIVFMVLDYITGLMCAVIDKKLSSAVGFKGICRKVLIFTLVGIGNILDVYVLGGTGGSSDGGDFLLPVECGRPRRQCPFPWQAGTI